MAKSIQHSGWKQKDNRKGRKFLFLLICCLFLILVQVWKAPSREPDNNKKEKKNLPPQKNPPPTAPASVCTKEQRKKITHQLLFQDDEDFKKGGYKDNAGRLAQTGIFTCPDAVWIENFYKEEGSDIGTGNSFLGISVGCNKGHDAIRTARMGLSTEEFDAIKWNDEFKSAQGGICRQEKSHQVDIVFPKRDGEMHCIEPMPSTFLELKRSSDALGLEGKGLTLTHAAISSAHGVAKFPSDEVGIEDLGLDACNNNKHSDGCEDVPVYSLEEYVDKYVKSKSPINILSIDVEGWDFDVLFGASSVLDRTHYIEFEYHEVGKWGNLHVQDAVRLLDGKGFTCYWAGKKRLWRITECYFEVYNHWHGWSNVACVHRSQKKLAERMEKLFLETLEAW